MGRACLGEEAVMGHDCVKSSVPVGMASFGGDEGTQWSMFLWALAVSGHAISGLGKQNDV